MVKEARWRNAASLCVRLHVRAGEELQSLPLRTLAPVRASARLKLRLRWLFRRPAMAILAPGLPDAFARGEGRTFMQRAVALACAALAFAMLGSPLGAQQSPAPQTAQPPAEAEPLPPPPPFPPLP